MAAPAVVAGQAPKILREETLICLEEPWSHELGKSPHCLFLFLSSPVWYLGQRFPAYSSVGKYISVISAMQSVVFCYSSLSTLMHGPCLHLQSQQRWVSLSYCIILTLLVSSHLSLFSFPSSTFKDLCVFSWADNLFRVNWLQPNSICNGNLLCHLI